MTEELDGRERKRAMVNTQVNNFTSYHLIHRHFLYPCPGPCDMPPPLPVGLTQQGITPEPSLEHCKAHGI